MKRLGGGRRRYFDGNASDEQGGKGGDECQEFYGRGFTRCGTISADSISSVEPPSRVGGRRGVLPPGCDGARSAVGLILEQTMDATIQLLVFELDGRRYALPLRQVERVIRAVDVTPLAGVPAILLGVIDVDGATHRGTRYAEADRAGRETGGGERSIHRGRGRGGGL